MLPKAAFCVTNLKLPATLSNISGLLKSRYFLKFITYIVMGDKCFTKIKEKNNCEI